jgi:SAM-dependent methyltransferase
MTTAEQRSFTMIYNRAKAADKLPWNHREPTHFLSTVAANRPKKGNALDIGCGSGVDSVYLAGQGWNVTSLDFVPDALRMTGERAKKAGIDLNIVQADVTAWNAPQRYDLIVDAGCLHNMKPVRHDAYRRRLMEWLTDDGDFVLVHYLKRHALDWRPVGPTRRSRQWVEAFFAPGLVEKDYLEKTYTGLPIVIGPTMAMSTYWFRRR